MSNLSCPECGFSQIKRGRPYSLWQTAIISAKNVVASLSLTHSVSMKRLKA